ncbi:MAG TPA: hypothetical protein VKB04_06500 [Anaerolineales bacterium]|nr:hypothetical protein [Anaerolineales bacterium]
MKTKLILVLILMFTVMMQAACVPSANACPSATSDTKLLTNTEDGYCLLYPAEDFSDMPGWVVINPISSPGDEPGDAWVTIQVQDAAGKSATQIADQIITSTGPGFNITRAEVQVDGGQAIVVDGLPGQDSNRMVLIVRNDRLYTLIFMPWYPAAAGSGQITPLEHLYETVMQSIHFQARA